MRRFVTLAVALVGVAACSGTDVGSPTGSSSSRPPARQPAAAGAETEIRIIVDNRPVTAHFADNPTARGLVDQLPLTLTFTDSNGVEKIAPLPRPVTTAGAPAGADPAAADIGYYAPYNNLVLYYGAVGYWNGIVPVGRFDTADLDFIRSQPDGFQATIERR